MSGICGGEMSDVVFPEPKNISEKNSYGEINRLFRLSFNLIFISFLLLSIKGISLVTLKYMKPCPILLKKRIQAYTLTEILVVLVIIGILILLALPNLLPLITRAKSLEAKTQLTHVQTLEQNYFYEHSKYSKDLTEIGFLQD